MRRLRLAPSFDMNEQEYSKEYNKQSLNAYLLGTLPEAEAERFDELSFTDENFADALNAAENDLVDDYVRGDVHGALLEKFKTHYLASPLRREKVAFAESFQVYAERQTAAVLKTSAAHETEKKRGFFSALNIFNAPNPFWQWSFAAAVLLFVAVGGWFLIGNFNRQNNDLIAKRDLNTVREPELKIAPDANYSTNSAPEKELATANKETIAPPTPAKEPPRKKETPKPSPAPQPMPLPVSIASFILAPSLRGGNHTQTVAIPARTAKIAAGLELESDDYADYHAVLRNPSDNRILWQSGKLKSQTVGGGKRLKINFPAALLKSEIYSVEVSGIAADGAAEIISDYSFRVVR